MVIKIEEKNYSNEVAKNNKNEKYQPKRLEVVDLNKSRIRQLMELKEEAESKGDLDKIQEIDTELFQVQS